MRRSPLPLGLALAALLLCIANAQDSCTTPNKAGGKCISIDQCPPLWALLKNTGRTRQETKLLLSSQCGQAGKLPKVCCEGVTVVTQAPTCMTPSFTEGKCVSNSECPSHVEILKGRKPFTAKTEDYLKKSNCQGTSDPSTCCAYPKVAVTPPSPPENLLPSKCGIMSDADRIFGGNVTEIDAYPWMALIEYKTSRNITKLSCAGSLISSKYVLTAAHCVYGTVYVGVGVPTHIRLGEFDTTTNPDCIVVTGGEDCNNEHTSIPIEKIIIHPEYDPSNSHINDIAIIRMKTDAPSTDFIKIICLPENDFTIDKVDNQFNVTVAGWGVTETGFGSALKMHLQVPFKTLRSCQKSYAPLFAKVTNKQVCAGGEPGKDSCRGDSGGPLMHIYNGRTDLFGVVSFGPTPCASLGVPGVYTKTYHYLDWIKSQMEL
ncbi:phenoloxidase-activating enzyme-like [Arctopsyche grandis]|uniref:phenoloxidase-activating enzyme-like n=1 Tax=Arctopsyche grandis TaxID=121162 RepID=UPI00406D848F